MAEFIAFGTDGVRGIANEELTPQFVQKLGFCSATYILKKYGKGKVLIGKDTRLSCDMLEHALISGMCSAGLDTESVGVIPTPGVAYLTKSEEAVSGAVISASHNPAVYNGIKFFGPKGFKLSEKEEKEIEGLIKSDICQKADSKKIGRSGFNHIAKEEYEKHLINCVDGGLEGIKIGLDCANGATFKVAVETITRLGAEVKVINDSPDGLNINENCGSTYFKQIVDLVQREGLDLGFAFDGDGDRVVAVDEKGEPIDGDSIMAICASHLSQKNLLKNNSVVVTTMTNLGFDIAMKKKGIKVEKCDVGDRFVLERMLEKNIALGGEQSGHIIFLDYATTGDGIVSALKLLEIIKETGKPLSELKRVMERLPQKLINIKVKNKAEAMNSSEVAKAKDSIDKKLGQNGRLLLRPSGTEPLVRVMVEAATEDEAEETALAMAKVISRVSGGEIV
jgi:phosphoglucosamine mutase